MDHLDGKSTDAATPLQGLWSIVVAAAAQESVDSGQAIRIDDVIERHSLDTVLQD